MLILETFGLMNINEMGGYIIYTGGFVEMKQ